VLVLCLYAGGQQEGIPNAADLEIALAKLNVLGSALYVGAHPDDENAAVLAYFSKGRKYRAAYLSLTRGEGGQNLIGPEQGAEIGLIRTQELLSARRIDGAGQFFTSAVDFGYSKSAKETLAFWGKEKILGDIVWVIRTFRPDVIISRFSAEDSGGHGHHIASGQLIQEAFTAAADPNRFPEQLKSVSPWKAKRLLGNIFRPPQEAVHPTGLRLDTGEYNPLLGKSYTEIAGESRSQHKSQGIGQGGRRGARSESFEVVAGDPASGDIFDGVDVSWNRIPGGQKVGLLLAGILESFDPRNPSASVPGLLAVDAEMGRLAAEPWVKVKRLELSRIIQACAGIWMEAIAADFAAAPGDAVSVRVSIVNRSGRPFVLHRLGFPGVLPDIDVDLPLKNNEPVTQDKTLTIPADYPISQPYWLNHREPFVGQAENPPALSAKIGLSLDGSLLEYDLPVVFRWSDPVQGELYRPFEIRPRVTLQIENKVMIFADGGPKKIIVRLKSHSPNVSGFVRLAGPEAWRITPARLPFSLAGKYAETEVAFDVTPPKTAGEAELKAEAESRDLRFSRSLVEIAYSHIRRQVEFPESRLKVVKLDIKTEGKKIGYIMGAGDEVPEALQSLGYEVVPLNDGLLNGLDLSPYDAVVTGVRAYNTRESLRLAKDKLMRYVEGGGTLIVQYNVASNQLANVIGPYPLTVGRDRVCVEDAPVSFLNPGHSLLNSPNKITAKDFDGWIQERGLHFASQWDDRYEPILSCRDPDEPDRKGGLLFARYGKGVFIYTGYAWFRQLPAGVPGAFRIFANLIAAGRHAGASADEKK